MYDRKLMKRLFWTITIFITATILTTLIGCYGEQRNKEVKTYNVEDMDVTYSIYVIDSCEYIVLHNGSASWGSHKGNCKNPIHNR